GSSCWPVCCFALFSASVAWPCWPFLPPGRAVLALITLSAITCQPCRVSPFWPVHWLTCMLPATLTSSPLWCFASASACLPNARTDNHIVAVPSSAWLHGRGTAILAIAICVPLLVVFNCGSATSRPRSEERRVGKDGRAGWGPHREREAWKHRAGTGGSASA